MNDRDCENCKHHTKKGCKSWNCKFEQITTREKAIKKLKDILEEATETDNSVCYVTSDDADDLKVAINSLEIDERYELEYEQIEPCEDAISRQAYIERYRIWGYSEFGRKMDNEALAIRVAMSLPPVTPQQKTGHWIDDKCSVCGKGIEDLIESHEWYTNEEPNFCPFCGVRVVESEDKK